MEAAKDTLKKYAFSKHRLRQREQIVEKLFEYLKLRGHDASPEFVIHALAPSVSSPPFFTDSVYIFLGEFHSLDMHSPMNANRFNFLNFVLTTLNELHVEHVGVPPLIEFVDESKNCWSEQNIIKKDNITRENVNWRFSCHNVFCGSCMNTRETDNPCVQQLKKSHRENKPMLSDDFFRAYSSNLSRIKNCFDEFMVLTNRTIPQTGVQVIHFIDFFEFIGSYNGAENAQEGVLLNIKDDLTRVLNGFWTDLSNQKCGNILRTLNRKQRDLYTYCTAPIVFGIIIRCFEFDRNNMVNYSSGVSVGAVACLYGYTDLMIMRDLLFFREKNKRAIDYTVLRHGSNHTDSYVAIFTRLFKFRDILLNLREVPFNNNGPFYSGNLYYAYKNDMEKYKNAIPSMMDLSDTDDLDGSTSMTIV